MYTIKNKTTNPMLMTDFYKTIHHLAYVPKLDYLVSYWTPRMSRHKDINKIVMFGLQGLIKEHLINAFNENFFNKPWEEIEKEYIRVISQTMTVQSSDTSEMKKLYELGYLPIRIKAVQEGERVNIKTPMFEISNTVKGLAWVVNYLETYISVNIWHPMTSATVAYEYRELVNRYYEKTVTDGVKSTACGDFSMRGMTSPDSAMKSSAGHLLSFTGTATIPAIMWLEDYYNCDCTKEIVGKGVPSTEHSVMSSYGDTGEFECYRHLIEDTFPTGPLSIVSDTYDYWNVLTNYLPKLKESILNRDGKIIIRGDSGDPIDIICGTFGNTTHEKVDMTPEMKGTVEILWEIFGGHINEKGYKVLDPHIGAIYGDGITIERAAEIYRRLEEKGFAASNCTLGIGSYTYQYRTRDTFGFALKCTHSVVDGVERHIYKDPITDKIEGNNFKKSQKGMCYVYRDKENILYTDEHTIEDMKKEEFKNNLLETVFENGKLIKEFTLKEIRNKLHKGDF